jgi:hypothetical protein
MSRTDRRIAGKSHIELKCVNVRSFLDIDIQAERGAWIEDKLRWLNAENGIGEDRARRHNEEKAASRYRLC